MKIPSGIPCGKKKIRMEKNSTGNAPVFVPGIIFSTWNSTWNYGIPSGILFFPGWKNFRRFTSTKKHHPLFPGSSFLDTSAPAFGFFAVDSILIFVLCAWSQQL
jgi:hypothetical protein